MRETASFEQFFRKNYEHFFFFALRFLGSEEDSRDIVDDAMEYVWVNYQDSSVDNWFRYTISFIRNKCIDKLRHDMVRRRYADFYKYVEEHKEEMSFEEDDERITLIKEAIALLPERTRYVLTECYVNKKKYKEIGNALGISDSAVKKHMAKALREIRTYIAKKSKKGDVLPLLWYLFVF